MCPSDPHGGERSSRLGRWARYVPLLIGGYFVLHVIIRLLISPSLGKDEAEQVLLAQQFAWGYGSQPPLYTWLVGGVFGALGAGILGLALVKNLLLAGTFLLTFALGRMIVGGPLAAALAATGLLLMPQVAWESQRALTHSVLVTFAAALFTYFLVRVLQRRHPADYALLGMAFAVGVLAKFNFPIIAVAMVLAALSLTDFRRTILDRRFLLTVAVSVLLLWHPLQWLIEHQQETLSRAHKLTSTQTDSLLMTAAAGIGGLGLSTASLVAPLLVVYGLATWRSTGTVSLGAPERGYLVLLSRSISIALAICVVLVLAFEVTTIKGRWLQPVFYLAPLALVLWAWPRLTMARIGAILAVSGLCAVVVITVLPLRTLAGPAIGRINPLHSPYPAFAAEIRRLGFDSGSVLASYNLLGGNMRLQFPQAVVLTPEYSSVRRLPDGPVLLTWDATRGDAMPKKLVRLYERVTGRGLPAVQPRFVRAKLLYSDRHFMRLGVALIAD